MSTNLESIIETLSNLTVLELNDLRKKLEEHWDVKAAAPMMAMAAAPAAGDAAGAAGGAGAKTHFNVVISGIADDTKKISIVKLVKDLTGLSLGDANKKLGELPYTVKENVATKEAEEMKAKLLEAGATVELK